MTRKILAVMFIILFGIIVLYFHEGYERERAGALLGSSRMYWVSAVENARDSKQTIRDFLTTHGNRGRMVLDSSEEFHLIETVEVDGHECASWTFSIKFLPANEDGVRLPHLTEVANCP